MHDPRSRRSFQLRLWFLSAVSITLIAACTSLFGFDDLRLGPNVPARPLADLTAGGNVSSSSKYRLVGVLTESPGSTPVGKSPSYQLYYGVVGTWH
jgi:hypothetical protein